MILRTCLLFAAAGGPFAAADDVLVTVNDQPITESALQLEAILRHVPDDQFAARRESLLEDLIDQQVMAAFVAAKRAQANPIELDAQVERIQALIRRRGEEPEAFFERIGLDEERLRTRLAQSLAWREYVRRITTDQQLRAYFHKHRRELDGTQIRAAHIILKAAPSDEAARQAAKETLHALRRQIEAGEVTFEDAAARHSQGPSNEQRGDVGFFAHRGIMSTDFSDAAFALTLGDVSQPVETAFGVHLIKVTDERPGQLSLEDVRSEAFDRIAKSLREELVEAERPKAVIERKP